MKPNLCIILLPLIVVSIICYLFIPNNVNFERADLAICKRENGWRKEQWVIPISDVSENYLVWIDWNIFAKSNCELLQKCARISSYGIPSDEITTGDIVWFTCTWNIIYPDKV